uniref:5'-3' DNA helicase ZGRF1-like N-terminal domain-containing protein n=1 Tax=Lactuca sativa TaxID=4236 RepID=A0A9R1WZJ3_LACSA|nr:hypothetical protein LSAT_V11C800444880 [Lactuca sativa]
MPLSAVTKVKLYDDCDKLLDSKIVKLDDAVKVHMSNSKTSKVSSRIGKTSSINLSPSQKIIREFKKREVKKYCSPPSYPDTSKDDSTEWQVLYTTQLTQKAKKFHDGILKVLISGLQGRQAILYDETRTQLDSRFLKKEETITLLEWNVMYTTQVTQKAKRFHDGVLKLASCGSQGREEATLLAEDGTILILTL